MYMKELYAWLCAQYCTYGCRRIDHVLIIISIYCAQCQHTGPYIKAQHKIILFVHLPFCLNITCCHLIWFKITRTNI